MIVSEFVHTMNAVAAITIILIGSRQLKKYLKRTFL